MMFPDDTTITKRCCRCNQVKPVSEFYVSRSRGDGYRGHCKECAALERDRNKARASERTRERRAENREAYLAKNRAYYQSHKDQWSKRREDPEWVAHNKAIQRAGYIANRDARIQATLDWINANPERKKLYRTATNHNARAKRQGLDGNITAADIETLLTAQTDEHGLHCAYCYTVMTDPTIDHIVPFKRGGTNWPLNLVLACRHCNRNKGAKLLKEWKPALYGR